MPTQTITVMISSTSQDLGIYREQVENACKGLGMSALMMEDLPAVNKDAVEVSLEMVDKADVYIGVFAHRYGYIPDGFEKSVTHLEYERAVERDIPRLIFLIDEDVPVKKSNIDTGKHAELLDGLKKRLLKERVKKSFKDPLDLSYHVLLSLALWEKKYRKEATLLDKDQANTANKDTTVSPLVDIPDPPEMDLPASPYKGPNRFKRGDAWVFFGRAKEIRELYKALVEKWCDPIILYCGESGVGKSSLLEAGVLPRLEKTHNVLYVRRDGDAGLASTLARELDTSPDTISEAWHTKETRTGKPLIVILDQVEEMYTSPVEEEGNAGYAEEGELVGMLTTLFKEKENRPKGRLVLAFRKEWSTDIESALNKASLPWKKIFLERLSVQGVLEVVQGPQSSEPLRKKYELDVEAGLPDVMAVEFLKDRQSSVGPELSITLTKMWQRVNGTSRRVFDEHLFNEMKDEGIQLSDFIEDRIHQLKLWNPEVARTGLYLDILHYFTTGQDTAESSRLEDVINRYPGREKTVEALIEWCLKNDLLTKTSEEGIRLVHDTLALLIVQKYRTSTLSGQRAERILENRIPGWLNGKTGAKLDNFGLKEVERGAQGMRGWNEDEKRLVSSSRRTRMVQRLQFGGVLGILALMVGITYVFRMQAEKAFCEGARDLRTWCNECQLAGGTFNTDIDDLELDEIDVDEHALYCIDANGFEGLSLEEDFVLIRGGTFVMGSEGSIGGGDEIPVHEVTISKDSWMSKTEVTQEHWYAVMGTNPSTYKGADRPVETVSWFDVQEFLEKLNNQMECAGCYRLPTEAEWEYAVRAGSSTSYHFGDDPDNLDSYAWYHENSSSSNPDSTTRLVGIKKPNAWGLYDMHGNVREWVQNIYLEYPDTSVIDLQDRYPLDAETMSNRVMRGGGWINSAISLRSANRFYDHPDFRDDFVGFRVVRNAP